MYRIMFVSSGLKDIRFRVPSVLRGVVIQNERCLQAGLTKHEAYPPLCSPVATQLIKDKVRPASSLAAMASPSLQLIYLDHHYWRAECARVALFMAGVPFEDARMDYNGTWMMVSGRRFVSNVPSWLASAG